MERASLETAFDQRRQARGSGRSSARDAKRKRGCNRGERSGQGSVPNKLERPRSHGGGFGLFSIRERLSLLGGSLKIHSKPGGGTIAKIVIPLSSAEAAGSLRELNS
jgi:signal transduction histidine kinase